MAEFIGNITEPEMSYTQNGKAKLEFRLPIDKRKKDGNEWVTVFTSWWGVTLWEEQAEAARSLLAKGTRVLIVGNPIVRPYESKQGEKRISAEIEVDHIGVIIPRKTTSRPSAPQQQSQQEPWAESAPTPQNGTQDVWNTAASYDESTPF